jgi:hypothetical protein
MQSPNEMATVGGFGELYFAEGAVWNLMQTKLRANGSAEQRG